MTGTSGSTGDGLTTNRATGAPGGPGCTTMSRYAVDVKDSLSVTVRLTLYVPAIV